MIDLITRAASAIPQTLADTPALTCLIILSLQLALIAAVAHGVTAWIAKGNAASVHPVWLIAIAASATLIPLHLLTSGWTLSFAVAAGPTAGVRSIDRNAEPVAVDSTENESGEGESTAIVDAFNGETSEDNSPPAIAALADHSRGATGTPPSGRSGALEVSEREPPIPASSLATAPPPWANHAARLASGIFATVYVSGFLIFAVRMIRGSRRLRACARRGRCLSPSNAAEAESLARSIGLSRSPSIRVTHQSKMPMVFGLRFPIVLVPRDFDRWDATERRATLLHEFTHIRRRDMLGQWMSRWVRAIYWFHPAAWLMDRRLAEAREWATDREVVDGEVDAIGYAQSLLAVVARLSTEAPDSAESPAAAIAMASHHDLEQRLNHILGASAKPALRVLLAKPLYALILIVLIAATTFHLEPVAAQRNESSGSAGSESNGEPPAGDASRENDLISRVQNCDVLTVTGDEFDAIFDVSGRVTDPEGKPIAGATVVLRESSTMRLSAEYQKYFDNEHRTLQRTQDVFARTTTNERGEFRIEDARSPALPKHWSNSWRGDVVAAHVDHGVGWEFLGDKQEIHRVESGLTIVLHPTTQISGTYQSPAGEPVVGAEIRCADLSKPQSERRMGHNLDLQNSQLAPLSLSDENGGFRLHGLPPGFHAIVTAWHSDWPMMSEAIATSADVADDPSRGTGYEISATLTSPATVIADPGVVIRGRVVDSQGDAIEGARVSRSSSTLYEETDSEGRYELRFTNRSLDRDRERNDGESQIYVRPPEESDLLGLFATVRVEDVIGGKAADFELQRGFRLTGEVVDAQGNPLEGIIVDSLPYDYSDGRRGSRTDSEGRYWSVLPAGGHLLAVATDQPGFAVPTYRQFRRATRDDAEAWTHQRIEGEVGQTVAAERFAVDRVQPIQVIVSLPDGKPAVGATAVLEDKKADSPAPGGGQLPGRFEDQSDARDDQFGWPRQSGTSGSIQHRWEGDGQTGNHGRGLFRHRQTERGESMASSTSCSIGPKASSAACWSMAKESPAPAFRSRRRSLIEGR